MVPKYYSVLAAIVFLLWPVYAQSERKCYKHDIRKRDTIAEVISRCGQPSYTYTDTTPVFFTGGHVIGGQMVDGSVSGGKTTQIFVYDIGRRYKVLKVHFSKGIVVSVEKTKP